MNAAKEKCELLWCSNEQSNPNLQIRCFSIMGPSKNTKYKPKGRQYSLISSWWASRKWRGRLLARKKGWVIKLDQFTGRNCRIAKTIKITTGGALFLLYLLKTFPILPIIIPLPMILSTPGKHLITIWRYRRTSFKIQFNFPSILLKIEQRRSSWKKARKNPLLPQTKTNQI